MHTNTDAQSEGAPEADRGSLCWRGDNPFLLLSPPDTLTFTLEEEDEEEEEEGGRDGREKVVDGEGDERVCQLIQGERRIQRTAGSNSSIL